MAGFKAASRVRAIQVDRYDKFLKAEWHLFQLGCGEWPWKERLTCGFI